MQCYKRFEDEVAISADLLSAAAFVHPWCIACLLRVSGAVERPLVSIGDRRAGDCERVHDDQQGPLHRDQRRQVPHSGHRDRLL